MKQLASALVIALLVICPAFCFAQDEMDEGDIKPAAAPRSYTGLSWGATHTIWNGRWNNEGYPEAGTLGPMISLRKISPMGSKLAMVPYINYSVLYSRVSEPCDTCGDGSAEIRSYFRELDLGLNLHVTPSVRHPQWYIGGGPMVRWGQAGQRIEHERRPGLIRKATWFGINLLTGLRYNWGEKRAVFVESQFVISPDMADRWQRNYPPETLSLQMGLLW